MTKVLYSSLAQGLKTAADREGRHFGKWVYGTKKDATAARSAANPSVKSSGGGSKARKPKVNTSALYWGNIPGPREKIISLAEMEATPAWFVDRKCVCPVSGGSSPRLNVGALTPALAAHYEVTGLKIGFHCGLLPRDVKVQALVLLAKTVVTAPDWDTISVLPQTKWFQDVQAINSSYKIPITRPINGGGDTDEAAVIVLFRAIDSDPAATAKVKFTITVESSQLKASTASLDF